MGSVDFIHFFVVLSTLCWWLLTRSLHHHFVSCYHQHMVYIEQCLHATLFFIEQCLHATLFFCSVVVILIECSTSSHADAGNIIASHLPKLKTLRKVVVEDMNPVPILVVVGSCGKLAEVVIINPEHCTVSFPEL